MINSQTKDQWLDEILTEYINHAGWSRLLSATKQYDENTLKQSILDYISKHYYSPSEVQKLIGDDRSSRSYTKMMKDHSTNEYYEDYGYNKAKSEQRNRLTKGDK